MTCDTVTVPLVELLGGEPVLESEIKTMLRVERIFVV